MEVYKVIFEMGAENKSIEPQYAFDKAIHEKATQEELDEIFLKLDEVNLLLMNILVKK